MTSAMTRSVPTGFASKKDNLSEAVELVDREYSSVSGADHFNIQSVPRFGKLFLFTRQESDQLTSVRDLIAQYVCHPDPPRPLSLAVFGQPGSGKSFAVKQVLNEVEQAVKRTIRTVPINLTQVSDPAAISEVLKQLTPGDPNTTATVKPASEAPAIVIFFDEFDAPRDGAPYGWLAWFLAPMQDGEYVHKGAVNILKRAIFIFAGGTAHSMQQFEEFAADPVFQAAKGPDFVSRLRGFLDIDGPNAEPKTLRRAAILRHELQARAVATNAKFRPTREVLESLLQVGRYRHGARSISAIVELSNLTSEDQSFRWEQLPRDHLLRLHVDRGALDARVIGGSIALSGYTDRPPSEADPVWDCWIAVARQLWREGATLSYAGGWRAGSRGELMKALAEELQKQPVEPSADRQTRENPYPRLENFVDLFVPDSSNPIPAADLDAIISAEVRRKRGLRVHITPHLSASERAGLDRWRSNVLERFRRRLAVSEISVARFVIAGANHHHYGRFAGIAEEAMLTLAQRKPVYLAGGFGGAAYEVGCLLGLSHIRTGTGGPSFQSEHLVPERSLDAIAADLQSIAGELRPGPWVRLPVTGADLISFLKAHALGGPRWPWNGLTSEENRELFRASKANEVARLVMRGLTQRFRVTGDPVKMP